MAAPPWLFPVPVRPSRFRAAGRAWERYNVEVALDLIPPFAFDGAADQVACLLWDCQTAVEGNWPGRLGSGRAGIYRERYLKGVGRTPAAANWCDPEDRYHGSGHMSVFSALRERLITVALNALGLGEAIVGCEAVLLAPLSPEERRVIAASATSSRPDLSAADATMSALTIKAADFARAGNFVFALDKVCREPRELGQLFLELERFLHPPSRRPAVEGAPRDIAAALDGAFEIGLQRFEAFARVGLQWVFTQSNCALDGRFVDLETPTFFGAPFVGLRIIERDRPRLLGFEEFGYVRGWRLFVAWLRARLQLLHAPALFGSGRAGRFVDELAAQIRQTFSPRHLLYADAGLVRRAVANLDGVLDLGPRGRRELAALARYAMRRYLHRVQEPLPAVAWQAVDDPPGPALPLPVLYEAAGFLDPGLTAEAERVATGLARLGAVDDVDTLLQALSHFRIPRARAAAANGD